MQDRAPTRLLPPRVTLFKKVFLALATLLVLLLLVFAGISILVLQRGLGSYAAEIEIRRMDWLAEILQKKYVADGGWSKLQGAESVFPRPTLGERESGGGDPFEPQDRRRQPPTDDNAASRDRPDGTRTPQFDVPPFDQEPPPFIRMLMMGGGPHRADSIYRRLGLTDIAGQRVAGAQVDPAVAARLPLLQGNRPIGFLVLAPMQEIESQADRAFVARQSGVIALTGVIGLIFALAISWVLARRWFAPIDELTRGAQQIAIGRLGTRVPARGSDELALLGRTFNSMAEQLDSIEASRRAWLADVAHELRTPLAAMRAEIEALQDGIRQFDDRTALRLHRQVMRLNQLVDDLRSSMREPEGTPLQRVPVFPLTLLREALAMTSERFMQRGIAVDGRGLDEVAERQPMMQGDAHRLHQVFMNLLENTMGHTDAGGVLLLAAALETEAGVPLLELRFDDSPPGPSDGELPHLFERLFRGDSSRSRETGGSGLGLSICRTLVEQHGGTIEAAHSPLGGLRMTLCLPLSTDP